MPSISPVGLIIVLVIVLLLFGPKRLPALGRSLGTGIREFKDSIGGKDDGAGEADGAAASRPGLPSSHAAGPPPASDPAGATRREPASDEPA
jgi:sec-independent protein translocase protein TatA